MAGDESGVWTVKRLSIIPVTLFLLVSASSLTVARASNGFSWSGESWHVASGVNGAGQRNCPSHVTVTGGHLFIRVSGGCGGGVAGSFAGGVGASWAVTFRDTRGGGKYAIGIWPTSGSRPEVDFAEDKPTDSARVLMTATYHPAAGCTGCIHSTISGDFTQWHTASVTHTQAGYVLSLDGHAWATYRSSFHGSQRVFIHNEAWGSSGSSTLEVASVHVG